MIWCSAGKVWPRFRDSPFLKRNIKLSRLYFKSCHINSEIICIWNLSIKPLSKSNVILTGDDSETKSHYFSILFFKLLPRKLLLILIISFWGWACDIAGDKKIKRSLVAQFRRSWKSVKLERVSYLQLSYIGNSWLKGEAQVFFTSSSHCWLLTHPYWHWRPSKKFPFRFYLFFKMTWVGKWERSSQGGILKRIENQFENPF